MTRVLAAQGYASPSQLAAGIHTRLYARAFLVADAKDSRCSPAACSLRRARATCLCGSTRDGALHREQAHLVLCSGSNRFVFVNMDACMASQAVTLAVHKRLQVSGCLVSR